MSEIKLDLNSIIASMLCSDDVGERSKDFVYSLLVGPNTLASLNELESGKLLNNFVVKGPELSVIMDIRKLLQY